MLEDKAWTGWVGDRSALAVKVKEAPESPGVYVYRGVDGAVLYVGKAKNLRNRLRSYFASTLAPKTDALMEKAASLETINVDSEKEALILELNLIKRHRPRYNIILRDDKQYPYIRVGVADKWPRVTLARRIAKDGARYFGPFTRAGAVRETLFLLRRIFPYRNCTDKALAQVSRPCLDYHIGRCLGPCTGTLDEAAYAATIDDVVKFLEGHLKEVRGGLQRKMTAHAESMEFEAAARVRDQIRALDDVTERQKITTTDIPCSLLGKGSSLVRRVSSYQGRPSSRTPTSWRPSSPSTTLRHRSTLLRSSCLWIFLHLLSWRRCFPISERLDPPGSARST